MRVDIQTLLSKRTTLLNNGKYESKILQHIIFCCYFNNVNVKRKVFINKLKIYSYEISN